MVTLLGLGVGFPTLSFFRTFLVPLIWLSTGASTGSVVGSTVSEGASTGCFVARGIVVRIEVVVVPFLEVREDLPAVAGGQQRPQRP